MPPKRRTTVLPGVNIQAPWAELIVCGKKTIETRLYPLPIRYVRTPIVVLETPGKNGTFKKRIVGIVTFGESFCYKNVRTFYADTGKHLISKDITSFGWNYDDGKPKWGWPVLTVQRLTQELPRDFRGGIKFSIAVPVNAVQPLR